ncbi:MAG: protein-export chaperone SecB [Gammaproteobacteria bacterium]|nr:protein-export chaperone SecB [Gammaproteobacteria bacterium]MCP4929583.1 protein-export chaperone SecB [Gammaproteobacteria bacterium]
MNTDTTTKLSNGNGDSHNSEERAFLLQQLYVKDLSFEAPNTPEIFKAGTIEPETELNIRNSHSGIGESLYEVVLHISVHAKKADDTIFLTELDQAGIFQIKGYKPEEVTILLGTQCPATLFPYAREAISSLVGKGGFPPLILQPINFDMLYARARDQQVGHA